jgi:nicotinic acid mononucleotide adenylyltransferase
MMRIKTIMALILASHTAHALVLEDMAAQGQLEAMFSKKTVAYYIGSFDPLHVGHEAVSRTIIQKGYADYVLIYPAWGGDSYKDRTPVTVRLDMLFSVFENDPHVIVTRLPPKALQDLLTTPNPDRLIKGKSTVYPKIPGLNFVGVIGSDVALGMAEDDKKRSVFMEGVVVSEAHKNTTIGGIIALPVQEFILSKRARDDVSSLKGQLGDRPITHEIISDHHELSSTRIREHLKASKPVDSMINPPVLDIIKEHHLYGCES